MAKNKAVKSLVKSIKEAGRIHRGACPASRTFTDRKKEANRKACRGYSRDAGEDA